MKLIFSRKGFDSSYGGVPSPIFDDGTLLSFPIPSRFGRPTAGLHHRGKSVAAILNALSGGKHGSRTRGHLDPDLDPGAIPRPAGWRPSLGQVAAAQRHLANQAVGPGDLFLFFGWFRHARGSAGSWCYDAADKGSHTLFGWLQIGEVLQVTEPSVILRERPWLEDHPHVAFASSIGAQNTIYVAADRLILGGERLAAPGAGVFGRWSPRLQLTATASSRSIWDLPGWMMPGRGLPSLTYHGSPTRWDALGDRVRLRSVAKGQEFVQHLGDHQEATTWVKSLVLDHA